MLLKRISTSAVSLRGVGKISFPALCRSKNSFPLITPFAAARSMAATLFSPKAMRTEGAGAVPDLLFVGVNESDAPLQQEQRIAVIECPLHPDRVCPSKGQGDAIAMLDRLGDPRIDTRVREVPPHAAKPRAVQPIIFLGVAMTRRPVILARSRRVEIEWTQPLPTCEAYTIRHREISTLYFPSDTDDTTANRCDAPAQRK